MEPYLTIFFSLLAVVLITVLICNHFHYRKLLRMGQAKLAKTFEDAYGRPMTNRELEIATKLGSPYIESMHDIWIEAKYQEEKEKEADLEEIE